MVSVREAFIIAAVQGVNDLPLGGRPEAQIAGRRVIAWPSREVMSRAQRSTSRRRVVRCRPGIVTHTTFAKVPEQRRTRFAAARAAPHPGHEMCLS